MGSIPAARTIFCFFPPSIIPPKLLSNRVSGLFTCVGRVTGTSNLDLTSDFAQPVIAVKCFDLKSEGPIRVRARKRKA